MQSYSFLNRKLREPNIKQRVKRSSEHYLLRWVKMELEVKSWWFRKASSLKELSKFSKFLRRESGQSSKQEFELFIPTSQTFQEPRSCIPLQAVTYNSTPTWQTHGSYLIKPFIQGSWWVIAVPQTSGLNQWCWWHLGNTNQEDTPNYRYSSTTIAFTSVSQKPKVMSPQPFPRDVDIKCRNDNRPIFLTRESFNPTREIEHSHMEHTSPKRRTCLAENNNTYRIANTGSRRFRPILSRYCSIKV